MCSRSRRERATTTGEGNSLIDTQGEEHSEEEKEEPTKVAKDPRQPGDREIEAHRIVGYCPYRSWCRWCVEGSAVGTAHTRVEQTSIVPRIGMD